MLATYPQSYEPFKVESPVIFRELSAIGDVSRVYAYLIPQVAAKAPTQLADGLIRMARSPWRPVAGQVADAWVYYDGPSASWKYL